MKSPVKICSALQASLHPLHHARTVIPLVFLWTLIGLIGSVPLNALAAIDRSHSQDALAKRYQQTLHAIRKGHRTNTRTGMKALRDYPLYPYLEKELLYKDIRDLPYQRVDTFLQQYKGDVVAGQLQRRWLLTLAEKKQWRQFLRYFEESSANTELRCYQLQALHQTGHGDLALSKTAAIWVSAYSLPNSCDPAFKLWQKAGMKTDELVWQRLQMALQRGNTSLARYLSKHASAALRPYTRRMLSVYQRPQRIENPEDFAPSNRFNSDIVAMGLTRLASRNPELSTDLWDRYRGSHALTEDQNYRIRDKIARQMIASGKQSAMKWLISHDPNAEDSYLLEWRIRLALRKKLWEPAANWITLLPAKLQGEPRWRYWSARAREASVPGSGQQLLAELAQERNYYGFLAAKRLGEDYDFNHRELAEAALDPTSTPAAIKRAEALFHMGELRAARREWFSGIKQLDQQQLAAATHLAHKMGWHQQAIQTTIRAKHWDDLSIRFPLAYQQDMRESAQLANIRLDWLYAITRQESAFAEDARSSANARGLMQLLPPTAQQVASSLGIPFNKADLYKPEKNIRLGSSYLKQLLERFDGNQILATAAYNAGPHRVDRWLQRQGEAMPYDIWIETLPFHETRQYVQSVLAFSVIYSHRLGLETPLTLPEQFSINHDAEAGE